MWRIALARHSRTVINARNDSSFVAEQLRKRSSKVDLTCSDIRRHSSAKQVAWNLWHTRWKNESCAQPHLYFQSEQSLAELGLSFVCHKKSSVAAMFPIQIWQSLDCACMPSKLHCLAKDRWRICGSEIPVLSYARLNIGRICLFCNSYLSRYVAHSSPDNLDDDTLRNPASSSLGSYRIRNALLVDEVGVHCFGNIDKACNDSNMFHRICGKCEPNHSSHKTKYHIWSICSSLRSRYVSDTIWLLRSQCEWWTWH